MAEYFLGIDTSNYTTSAALVRDGQVLLNVKRPVKVKEGEHGIRQSDAVFSHVQSLPDVLAEIGAQDLTAVGVSTRPRDVEGSYMPCFLAGKAAATGIASLGGLRLYEVSHQWGHLMAALYGACRTDLYGQDFLAFHVSGGTTELLRVRGREVEKVGGTLDLNAGQVIDRIGVKIGIPFPAGRGMEEIALPFSETDCWSHVRGLDCNLSGLENKADALLAAGQSREKVAAYVLKSVCRTLEKLTENAFAEFGKQPVLFAGGVMSNRLIKEVLQKRFCAHFAPPAFSADNAAGVALLAERMHKAR
ncbi:MAG: peptidase M22 [Clostridia bacterium]|nr:peptidase M22 [Clostridia bacterium]